MARVNPDVEQVSTEQQVMLHENGEDYHGILTSLRFVDGDRPGQGQFGQISIVLGDLSLGKLDHDLLLQKSQQWTPDRH